MSKIELHTTVEERITCEDISSFAIKKINLGKIYLWTPWRGIYLSTDIPANIRDIILEMISRQNSLFEINRTIYKDISYEAINYAVEENDEERIKNVLRINDYLSDNANILISLSFSGDPSNKMGDNFEELLDYIHAFSSIPFVPHIRYGKTKTSQKYSAKYFCKYVDSAMMNILQERNTKPLFVPFDIEYDKSTRNEILTHYAKQGYTNIWIDFKGHVFSKVMIGRMRTLWRIIAKKFGRNAENVVVYLANIKKIPRTTPRDIKFRPSDFLGVFSYGDIVGAPWKGITVFYQAEEGEEYCVKKGYSDRISYEMDMFKRDCSVFESETYYYVHPDIIKIDNPKLDRLRKNMLNLGVSRKYIAEKLSYSISGTLTLNELNQIKKEAEDDGKIADYVSNKEFFQKEGSTLLEELKKSMDVGLKREKSIFDFI